MKSLKKYENMVAMNKVDETSEKCVWMHPLTQRHWKKGRQEENNCSVNQAT